MKTQDAGYTKRLSNNNWWKNLLDVQKPYRNHIQSLNLGKVLEIGCGVGRNLINLGGSIENIGIDHNPTSVNLAKERGLSAFTPEEFKKSITSKTTFDTLLVAHVLEHLTKEDAKKLLEEYLPWLKSNGKVMIITPQKAGFASDPTHVTMMNPALVGEILKSAGLDISRQYSFPFPYWVGNFFKYNENISLGIKLS
jgi:2-polyprenyl-3-methyl-5-hydroxy-6-metoxy-1,4-benzoquinol methylase